MQNKGCKGQKTRPNNQKDLSDPTLGIVVIWVKTVQAELMVEIYSKSLVRAIGKVLIMKFC